jgi:hypothetical protein
MRKLVPITALGLTLAVAVPLALAAGPNRSGGQLDRQQAAWRSDPVSTSSSEWRTIGRFSFVASGTANRTICAEHEVSLSLSADLHGAPVLFRVVLDGGGTFAPGPARFVPAADSRTFAASFAGLAGTFEGSDRHALEVQWRSPSGRPVTLDGGLVNVLYEQGAAC